MPTVYNTRDQTAQGTLAAPPLLNVTVGDPLLRTTNADYTTGGQAAIATGGTDRPNDVN